MHPRFPRIATFATQRIRLRNALGGAYADPSVHISGIVHSCPHLGYLNYICNAYRGAVGTEYVGAAAAPAHAPATSPSYALTQRRITHNAERSRARSANIRRPIHMLFYVCVFAVAEACRRSLRAVTCVSDRVSRVQAQYKGMRHAYKHARLS